MDGVKARLPFREVESRAGNLALRGKTSLENVERFLSSLRTRSVTHKTETSSFKINGKTCNAKVRLLVAEERTVIAASFFCEAESRASQVLKNLSDLGWGSSLRSNSYQFAFRYLRDPAPMVVTSQLLLFMREIEAEPTNLFADISV